MRRLFLMLMISLIAGTMAAQPKKSRVQQNNKTAFNRHSRARLLRVA